MSYGVSNHGFSRTDGPRYIWWKTLEAALHYPDRLIVQVMDMGTFEDMRALVLVIREDRLTDILRHADPGWFRPQSWAYWHYRLQRVDAGTVLPSLPQRKWV